MEQARKLEQDCDSFVHVFITYTLPRLHFMLCRAGVTVQEANCRVSSCQAMVLDSLWHWAQQDGNVNLQNIAFFRQSPPHVRAHITMQRYKQPHPQPPMTLLLDQIRPLCHRDKEILEFVRDLNYQMSYRYYVGHVRSNSFSCAALCRVQGVCTKSGQRAVNIVTWGGSVPLPRHLKEEYINYASRYIWHPLVGLQVLLNRERSPSGQLAQVVPNNTPNMLLCSTYTFNQHHDGRVEEVYPCSYCRVMFPSRCSPTGYVHYTKLGSLHKANKAKKGNNINRFSRGNCAECAAFSAMFHVTRQTCRIVGAEPRITLQRLGVGQQSVPYIVLT